MSETAVLPLPLAPLRVWRMSWVRRVAVLVPMVVAVALAGWLCFVEPFPGPDELEHVSYAAILQESGRFLPRFDLAVTLYRSDLALWSDRVNYVGHPSIYYHYIAAFLDRSLPMGEAVARVRLASLALLAGGVLAGLAGGVRAFRSHPALLVAFGVGVAWCPEVLTVASYVNNDALAILGGGLGYWGAVRDGERGGDGWGRWAMGAGVAVALWAKPNAGLEVGLFTGLHWLLVPGGLGGRRDWRVFASLAAGAVVGMLPTVPIVLRYGVIVPVSAEAVWPVRSMASFGEYWPVFLSGIGQTWGYSTFARWPMPDATGWARTSACWVFLAVSVVGGVAGMRRLDRPGARVAAAAALTFVLVVPLHLAFASSRLGFSIPAASFRYYLALWPGLLHAFLFLGAAGRRRWVVPGLLVLAGGVLALGYLTDDTG